MNGSTLILQVILSNINYIAVGIYSLVNTAFNPWNHPCDYYVEGSSVKFPQTRSLAAYKKVRWRVIHSELSWKHVFKLRSEYGSHFAILCARYD